MVLESIITVSELTKRYRDGTEALKKISLDIPHGSRFVLLGPNGAGKTTLVRILSTLSKETSGDVLIGGEKKNQSASSIRKKIGVALQSLTLDPEATPLELLVFQGGLFGIAESKAGEKALSLINRFGLEKFRDKKIRNLSGGNKRRIHIALALVHDPSILFLDEPTVGMDPEGRYGFWSEMKRLNTEKQMTLFMTTQYLEEAQKNSDIMAVILDGEIVFSGKVSDFISLNPGKEGSGNSLLTLEEGYLNFIEEIRQGSGL